VERSSDDPSVVITTYEGQHCHHTASTVAFQRGAGAAAHHHIHSTAAAVALAEQMPFLPAAQRRLYNSLPPLHPQSSPPSSETAGGITSALTSSLQHHLINGSERVSMPSTPSSSSVAPATSVEKGLLDDIVPHGVRHG
jgi:hypothetical protein